MHGIHQTGRPNWLQRKLQAIRRRWQMYRMLRKVLHAVWNMR